MTRAGYLRSNRVRLHATGAVRSRNGKELGRSFPEIAEAAGPLTAGAVVDGELIAVVDGEPSLDALLAGLRLTS